MTGHRQNKTLLGQRVALTRTKDVSADWTEALQNAGAEVLHVPLTKTQPLNLSDKQKDVLKAAFKSWDWIVFTSRNGVHCFFQKCLELKIDVGQMETTRFATVGKKTTEALRTHVAECHHEASVSNAESLAQELIEKIKGQPPRRILLPKPVQGLTVLEERLKSAGHSVLPFPVYETLSISADSLDIIGLIKRMQEKSLSSVVVFSPSQARRLWALIGDFLNESQERSEQSPLLFWSIGPTTHKCMKECGFLGLRLGDTDPLIFLKKLKEET